MIYATTTKTKQFCVKRSIERLFGLEGVHRWDPFLVLPPSGWETALHTCTFLLLMFTRHRRLDMTGIVLSFFFFFLFSLFVRHAMGNKCILCFRSVLAAITRLYGEVLVRKKMNKKNERKTSICTLRPRVSRAESFPSLCYRSIHAVRHGNVYSILMDLWYICQFGISRTWNALL